MCSEEPVSNHEEQGGTSGAENTSSTPGPAHKEPLVSIVSHQVSRAWAEGLGANREWISSE